MPGRVIMSCQAETLVNVLLIALSCVNLFRVRGFVRLALVLSSFNNETCVVLKLALYGLNLTHREVNVPVHDANDTYSL